MNLSKEGCRKVPIWAHFYNVPLEFWTEEGLSYIASMVGKPLHADKMTTSRLRLSYARICIEIDIDDSLPDAFDIELEDGSIAGIQIVYNWIPKRCSTCKVFGHLSSNCKISGRKVWIPKHAPPYSLPLREEDRVSVVSNRKAEPVILSFSPKPMHASAPMSQDVHISKALPFNGLHSSVNPFSVLRSDEVPPVLGLHDEPASADVQIASVAEPIPVDVPFGPGVRDQIVAGDLSGVGDGNPLASDDPTGIGAGDPLSFSDPNAMIDPMAIASGSPDRDRSDFSCHPVTSSSISIDQPGPSPPSSSPSSTPLLARKLIMIDEVEMKQGRKKKKDKQLAGCSGLSRGKLSKTSK